MTNIYLTLVRRRQLGLTVRFQPQTLDDQIRHEPGVFFDGGGVARGRRVEQGRERHQTVDRGRTVRDQKVELAQRDRTYRLLFGEVQQEPPDARQCRLDVVVVDVAQAVGVLAGLAVHQRNQLGVGGGGP